MMEEKAGEENPDLSFVSAFHDAVHVAKRKQQSFSNWFLWVDGVRVNLVQLRELRNDPSLNSKLSEKIPLSAVRNRDRQDVDSILHISDVTVTDTVKGSAVVVTHTVVSEKYRITDDNKKGILKSPVGLTMGPLGNVFISDVGTGKILKVRASHYPASVAVEFHSLDCSVGIAFNNGVLYIAESTIGDKIVETLYLNRVTSENKRIRTPPLSPPFKVGVFVVFYR